MTAFYKIISPEYTSDREEDKQNPLEQKSVLWMPGIICDVCGETWAGNRKLLFPVPERLRKKLGGAPLPTAAWMQVRTEIIKSLGLSDGFAIRPGDQFGIPIYKLNRVITNDLTHLYGGTLIVTANVLDALQNERITGFEPVPINLQWIKKLQICALPLPTLYLLKVTGQAWRIDSTLASITACKECERMIFPNPQKLIIDEKRWDGADFFNVDLNPGIIFVTEKVCYLLAANNFSNYSCLKL